MQRTQQGARLLQIGEQEVAFGAKFRARVVLDIEVPVSRLADKQSCSTNLLLKRLCYMLVTISGLWSNRHSRKDRRIMWHAGVLDGSACEHVRERGEQWQQQQQARAGALSTAALPAAQ